nr:hypothetical protein [Fodinibius sp.]
MANDGIWGNNILVNRQLDAVYLDLNVDYQNGGNIKWPAIKNSITVVGSVTLPNAIIGADNINGDGFVNPGEVIRYTLKVENHSAFDLFDLKIEQLKAIETDYAHDLMTPYPW